MRAVLDVNVLVSALLSRTGAPALLLERWFRGEFELVASEQLLAELERATAYPKLRARISADDARAFLALVRSSAVLGVDPQAAERRSSDPGDDSLLALAAAERAILVTGDQHLLSLGGSLPVETPRAFLERLQSAE